MRFRNGAELGPGGRAANGGGFEAGAGGEPGVTVGKRPAERGRPLKDDYGAKRGVLRRLALLLFGRLLAWLGLRLVVLGRDRAATGRGGADFEAASYHCRGQKQHHGRRQKSLRRKHS